jgi:hypothetical protein
VKKPLVIGALAVAAFAAAVVYLGHHSRARAPASMQAAPQDAPGAEAAMPAAAAGAPQSPAAAATGSAAAQPAPSDPRLIALAVSPDNGLIEFVRAPDGKVIAEIDKDPNSLGFRKPSREYLYSGDKVVGLTAYRYFADHVEVSSTRVSYKPDGSVDQLAESTRFENGKKSSPSPR